MLCLVTNKPFPDIILVSYRHHKLNGNTVSSKPAFTGNFNDLKEPGFYWCNFSNITNGPFTSGYGWVTVLKFPGGGVVQIIMRYNAGNISSVTFRSYINNAWHDYYAIKASQL